ncbi:trehalose operon repressor [Desnuesiella massiliensis]|uniref:trehalose operon repressor n=1 Tax=Desnuesiella massiliensis TaxID=1650662 RepID=UPI0006E214AA|nr:trehalose operon repressor [Desnuesiella massiliensis]
MNSKYLTIYNEILTKIENGFYPSNTKLPSENELMEQYNVSRDTIRKSLNLLEDSGHIHKIKGKGSLILDINKFNFPVSGITSFKELTQNMGVKSETIVQELECVNPDKFLKAQLNLNDEAEAWKVIRVRKIDGKKIILDKDFFNKEFVPVLTEEICKDSIYEYIEKELGLRISFAKKEITVQQCTEEDKKYLDCENYNMIVVVKSYTYLNDTSLFQYTESRHRPDKFRFVDFARRSY